MNIIRIRNKIMDLRDERIRIQRKLVEIEDILFWDPTSITEKQKNLLETYKTNIKSIKTKEQKLHKMCKEAM